METIKNHEIQSYFCKEIDKLEYKFIEAGFIMTDKEECKFIMDGIWEIRLQVTNTSVFQQVQVKYLQSYISDLNKKLDKYINK